VVVKTKFLNVLKNIFCAALILSSCTTVRNYQKGKPFLFKNSIELKGGNFNTDERNLAKQRLYDQLDDSAKVVVIDKLFLFHKTTPAAAYDTAYSYRSARNMIGSMLHLGYYQAKSTVKIDTVSGNFFSTWSLKFEQQQRVYVKYVIDAGNPTLVDTFSYHLNKPELQRLAIEAMPKSLIKEGNPVSKGEVLGEIARMVDVYRNNGYYKFITDDLRMRGDTTILSLTTISDDPFENIRLLAEANQKRNKPTIKLEMILNPLADSMRLQKFYIGNVYIYPDYNGVDSLNTIPFLADTTRRDSFVIRYHKKLFRNNFLLRNMDLKKGDLYRQENYAKTLSNFSKTGVWQNINIQTIERKDSVAKLDMILQMIPARKYGFEANVEASYSVNSNTNTATITNGGNLLGLSTNLSLQNRNIHKEGIKMTHAIRYGVELNLNTQRSSRVINSNELSYTNTISFPRLLGPIKLLPKSWFNNGKPLSQQTFINTNPSYTKRIDLFNLFSTGLAFGNQWSNRSNRKNTIKFPNIEYSYLFNQSDSFRTILNQNPYLRYSYNTALIIGSSYNYSSSYVNPKHTNRLRSFNGNIEESGLIWGRLGIFKKELRQFVKVDGEYTFSINNPKSARVFRAFLGVGIPLENNDTASLPFFKQYFSGGANSMRGWPIRGIGPGAKPLVNNSLTNDRTGDIRFEVNAEYRHDLFQIIPNQLVLKWAVFTDIGNVWNFRNTKPGGGIDSLQFQFQNFYKQLGADVGTGFRFDFTYVVLRFDLGFRVKKPEIAKNDGWEIPDISYNHLLKGGDENSKWRRDNFNFTIGLSYPF
jgi:outer membrane protein insertion porin family